jgi:hypothetical protein
MQTHAITQWWAWKGRKHRFILKATIFLFKLVYTSLFGKIMSVDCIVVLNFSKLWLLICLLIRGGRRAFLALSGSREWSHKKGPGAQRARKMRNHRARKSKSSNSCFLLLPKLEGKIQNPIFEILFHKNNMFNSVTKMEKTLLKRTSYEAKFYFNIYSNSDDVLFVSVPIIYFLKNC